MVATPPQNNLDASCRTDIGKCRSRNEDVCANSVKNKFFLVADGIGGSAAGDIASQIFKESAFSILKTNSPSSINEGKDLVINCFQTANDKILAHVATNPLLKGMGCTAELLLIIDNDFVLGHVGDSRTYRLCSQNNFQVITRDHSLVQEQLDQGILSEYEAQHSKLKNILIRAIGIDPHPEVDIISGTISSQTLFLLCTDGLHNMISAEQIEAIMRYDAPLDLKTELLISMANDAGGKDNITVSLVEVLR